jgi:hypothetical protein
MCFRVYDLKCDTCLHLEAFLSHFHFIYTFFIIIFSDKRETLSSIRFELNESGIFFSLAFFLVHTHTLVFRCLQNVKGKKKSKGSRIIRKIEIYVAEKLYDTLRASRFKLLGNVNVFNLE